MISPENNTIIEIYFQKTFYLDHDTFNFLSNNAVLYI